MNKSRSLIRALFLLTLVFGLISVTAAQKISLPGGLTEKSTLEEVLKWLDENALADARIGIESDVQNPSPGDIPVASTAYSQDAVFDSGFRLSKSEGCHLVLTNKSVKLLSFASANPDWSKGSFANFRKTGGNQAQFAGNLYIALEQMYPKRAKSTYRLTDKPEKAKIYGTWRTKFKGSVGELEMTKVKWRTPPVDIKLTPNLLMEIVGSGAAGGNEQLGGGGITFTFDDKEKSDRFYAAFYRAIELCSED